MTDYCIIAKNHLETLIQATQWGHKDVRPDDGRFREDSLRLAVEHATKALATDMAKTQLEKSDD